MRSTIVTLVILIFSSLAHGQDLESLRCRNGASDKYSSASVTEALRMAESGGWWSFAETNIANLGDGFSVAVLKTTGRSELLNPSFVRGYLVLAKAAFSRPEITMCAEDRKPDVTIFLLDYIRDHLTDAQLVDQIDSVKRFIMDRAKDERLDESLKPAH